MEKRMPRVTRAREREREREGEREKGCLAI